MGLDIAEALSGMGKHGAAIPPHIIMRQMKVRYPCLYSQLLMPSSTEYMLTENELLLDFLDHDPLL